MARDLLNAWVRLDWIHCYDEGDGWGNAEPYLWTVFFKIDGSGVRVTEALKLSGNAVVEPTPGSHGNLGDNDVDAGDDVRIPSAIGEWKTLLRPIPVPDSIKPLVDDLPAVVGVVCVLMEEDNVSDAGAEAGHNALNSGVAAALEKIIATRSFSNPDIKPQEIDQYLDAVAAGVSAAVEDEQGFFENIWSWLNADDTIGSKVFYWKQDDIFPAPVYFSQRWENEGDWEIFGHVNATVACPASGLAAGSHVLDSIFQTAAPRMREFRDSEFAGTGLAAWWALAERNAPELTFALQKEDSTAAAAGYLLKELPGLLDCRDDPLPEGYLDRLDELLRAVSKTGSRQARRDTALILDVLPQVRDMTAGQVLEFLDSHPPHKSSGKAR